MKEPSEARKRTQALHERAIQFSTNVNRSYPEERMNYPSEVVWGQLIRAADGILGLVVDSQELSVAGATFLPSELNTSAS